MFERLGSVVGRLRGVRGPGLLVVGAVVGFIAVLAVHLQPPDPESRLPGSYRLAALIQRQQNENQQHQLEVGALRSQLNDERTKVLSEKAGRSNQSGALGRAGLDAGMVGLQGPGFTVTLDDSSLSSSSTGNVNDLVIHSQDVQAVVNGMWGAGAEAVAINDQRLVGTSAILCVGNTLLLNGTVHSPPYLIKGVGPDRSQFQDDPLVRQLKSDADRFSLRFSIGKDETLEVPPYAGPTAPHYAQPATN